MLFINILAVYFVIWWVVFFAVLPLWSFSSPSTDAQHPLIDPASGAPEHPYLGRKLILTSVLSLVILILLWVGYPFFQAIIFN